ncbi:MAG: hypothetical protein JSW32_01445 [Deltaproteobacteria bacterium]|nr:MAG: hypothetical protein JSW32_01445 [Deltaproteobacteria bacterium]
MKIEVHPHLSGKDLIYRGERTSGLILSKRKGGVRPWNKMIPKEQIQRRAKNEGKVEEE